MGVSDFGRFKKLTDETGLAERLDASLGLDPRASGERQGVNRHGQDSPLSSISDEEMQAQLDFGEDNMSAEEECAPASGQSIDCSTSQTNARQARSAMQGTTGWSVTPERHSHAGRDEDEAMAEVSAAGQLIAEATSLAGQDKARGSWIQTWLRMSYELHHEGNVSRTALYARYVAACDQFDVKPSNAASFGKAIKSQWPEIKASQHEAPRCAWYHYIGLHPAFAAEADALHLVDLDEASNSSTASITTIRTPRQPPARSRSASIASTSSNHSTRPASLVKSESSSGGGGSDEEVPSPVGPRHALEAVLALRQTHDPLPQTPTTARPIQGPLKLASASAGGAVRSDDKENDYRAVASTRERKPPPERRQSSAPSDAETCTQKTSTVVPVVALAGRELPTNDVLHSRRRGSRSLSISVPPPPPAQRSLSQAHALPNFPPSLQTAVPPLESLPIDGFPAGIADAFVHAAPTDRWPERLEQVAREVWLDFVGHCRNLQIAVSANRFDEVGAVIVKWWTGLSADAMVILQLPPITSLVFKAEAALYGHLLSGLHAKVFLGLAPALSHALDHLALNMESVQGSALSSFRPGPFSTTKIELGARFGHLLGRHVGLCQLSQSLGLVMNDPNAVRAMAITWDQINFTAIKNQAALVCNCDSTALEQLFTDFGHVLWSGVANPVELLVQFATETFERCLRTQTSPRSLVVRWSFVASQLMRDLTLRSVPSLGAFHTVNIFLEEFLAFQVVKRMALDPIAILAGATPRPTLSVQPPPPPPGAHPLTMAAPGGPESSNGSSHAHNGSSESASSVGSGPFPPPMAGRAPVALAPPTAGPLQPHAIDEAPANDRMIYNLQAGPPQAGPAYGGVLEPLEVTTAAFAQHRRMGPTWVESAEGVAYAAEPHAEVGEPQRSWSPAPGVSSGPAHAGGAELSPFPSPIGARSFVQPALVPGLTPWDAEATPAFNFPFSPAGGSFAQGALGPGVGFGGEDVGVGMMKVTSPRFGGLTGCFGELSAGDHPQLEGGPN